MSDLSLEDNDVDFGEASEFQTSYRDGEVIFLQNEVVKDLNIVLSGKVKLLHQEKNKFQSVDIKGPKEFLDEVDLFLGSKRSFCAIAVGPTTVLKVNKTDIKKILKRCPNWVDVIMKTLSERLSQSIEMMREHNIIDEMKTGGKLTPKEENIILDAIGEYKNG